MSPLKVLILGVPMHRPNVRVVINCPMSGPAGAGHGGHWGGPEGTLPPAGCSRKGMGYLNGPHFPPPSKGDLLVILLRLSTAQWAYPFIWRGLLGGTVNLHCAIS